jgi:hypothetical protein
MIFGGKAEDGPLPQAGDDALDLSWAGQVIDAIDAVHVTRSDGMEQRQVSTPPSATPAPRPRAASGQPKPLDELTDTVAPRAPA